MSEPKPGQVLPRTWLQLQDLLAHSRTHPARRLAIQNFPGKVAHEVPYSEPPLPTFRPSDEDEALL